MEGGAAAQYQQALARQQQLEQYHYEEQHSEDEIADDEEEEEDYEEEHDGRKQDGEHEDREHHHYAEGDQYDDGDEEEEEEVDDGEEVEEERPWQEHGHPFVSARIDIELEGGPAEGKIEGFRPTSRHGLQFLAQFSNGVIAILNERQANEGVARYAQAVSRSGTLSSVQQQQQPQKPTSPSPATTKSTKGPGPNNTNTSTFFRVEPLPEAEGKCSLTPEEVTKLLLLLRRLATPHFARGFSQPVADLFPELLKQYVSVIKYPMDLGTIYLKVQKGLYPTIARFNRDVELVWANCERFNCNSPSPSNVAYARHLASYYKTLFHEMILPDGASVKEQDRSERMIFCRDLPLSARDITLLKKAIEEAKAAGGGVHGVGRLESLVASFPAEVTAGQIGDVIQAMGLKDAVAAAKSVLDAYHFITATLKERRVRGTEFSSIWAQPARLVWAAQKKLGGTASKSMVYWPGMVLMYGDTPEFLTLLNESRMPVEYQKGLKRQSRSSNSLIVETFGAHDFMWSPPEQIIPYTGPDSYPPKVKKPVRKETFTEGVKEIERAWRLIDNNREDEDVLDRFQQMDWAKMEARLAMMANPTESEIVEYICQQKHAIETSIAENSKKAPRSQGQAAVEGMGGENKRQKKNAQVPRKVRKARALDKVREFIKANEIAEKILKELDLDNRPKLKRRAVNTPPPFSNQWDLSDMPITLGGKPTSYTYDPYETESDFEDGPEAEGLNWYKTDHRKVLLRQREACLRVEIHALNLARQKQRDFAERALGRPWGTAAGDLDGSGGGGTGGGTSKRPRRASGSGIKRPRASPSTAAGGGGGRGGAMGSTSPVAHAAAASGGVAGSGAAGGHEEGGGGSGVYQRSQYIGVCRNGNRWLSRISYGGKKYSLGGFDTEREAALTYDKAAREQFGDKAKCNFDETGTFPLQNKQRQYRTTPGAKVGGEGADGQGGGAIAATQGSRGNQQQQSRHAVQNYHQQQMHKPDHHHHHLQQQYHHQAQVQALSEAATLLQQQQQQQQQLAYQHHQQQQEERGRGYGYTQYDDDEDDDRTEDEDEDDIPMSWSVRMGGAR